MYHKKFSPRADYRLQEGQRMKDSVTLADKFKKLKSLTVELAYFNPEGVTKNSEIKYTVNLANAKSVFRFDCMNNECVGGDFDLSEVLAKTIATRQATASGEMRCHGWLSKTTIDRIHCNNILRYKLSFAY